MTQTGGRVRTVERRLAAVRRRSTMTGPPRLVVVYDDEPDPPDADSPAVIVVRVVHTADDDHMTPAMRQDADRDRSGQDWHDLADAVRVDTDDDPDGDLAAEVDRMERELAALKDGKT